ncbi:redoxin domain-containing protein [candidate division KSB1 bacterium]
MCRKTSMILFLLLLLPVLSTAQIQVGQQAPDFTLNDVSGNSVSLTDYQGYTVVLYFFTSW